MNMPRRILHIDDDPIVTQLVAANLKKFGYTSTTLHDPRQVMQQLHNFQERVVIMDIGMPWIDGLDLLRQIKSFDGGIQVIMLTGLETMTTVLESLRLGAEACFFKPLDEMEPLVGAIEACFQKLERWMAMLNELSRRRQVEHAVAGELRVVHTALGEEN